MALSELDKSFLEAAKELKREEILSAKRMQRERDKEDIKRSK